jgi:hypothetical protein
LSLVYRIEAFHEPSLDGADFDAVALQAENCWAGLPEATSYQFYVFVDQRRGVGRLEQALPPIVGDGAKERLFEEFRGAAPELTRIEDTGRRRTWSGPSPLSLRDLPADHRQFLAARRSFRACWPAEEVGPERTLDAIEWTMGDNLRGACPRGVTLRPPRRGGPVPDGPRLPTLPDGEIVGSVYELLNPTASAVVEVDSLSERARLERDGLPRSIVDEMPFTGDTSPVWSLLNDDLLIRRDHLRLGDRYIGVISLKELPDRTEPGIIVPLLALNRERYVLYYRVDIPRAGAELAALRAKATLAAGLKLENFIVKSDRTDPQANAVEKQTDAAMERIISSTQRIFGTTLQLVLYEGSAGALEEAVQETLGILSRAHGLRGYRETYLLKEAYLSLLPGAAPLMERRRKTLTPVMVDMLPIWGFQSGEGKIPFLTPHNGLVSTTRSTPAPSRTRTSW